MEQLAFDLHACMQIVVTRYLTLFIFGRAKALDIIDKFKLTCDIQFNMSCTKVFSIFVVSQELFLFGTLAPCGLHWLQHYNWSSWWLDCKNYFIWYLLSQQLYKSALPMNKRFAWIKSCLFDHEQVSFVVTVVNWKLSQLTKCG